MKFLQMVQTSFFKNLRAEDLKKSFKLTSTIFTRMHSTSPPSITPMFLLTYKYDAKDETELANRRSVIRPLHLEHAQKAKESGKLYLGGASLPISENSENSNDGITGVLIFRNSSLQDVENFAKTDPYVTNKAMHGIPLVKSYTIRSWNVVIKPDTLV